ncbi:MAG: rhodanese-like domain-containing protein [Acidobacteria bacterium]|nr:rhodanese-like domain-containing protein [Acidobacteriota bacterium]
MKSCIFPLEVSPQEVKQKIEAGARFRLIDVREPFEYQLARISGSELIPMQTIPTALQTIQREATQVPIIFFCHHGIRSLQVVNWLREYGVEACQSMQGGIERWSLEIDPTIPRYH